MAKKPEPGSPIGNRPTDDKKKAAVLGADDAELLRIARREYQKDIDADQDNLGQMEEDLEFLAGEQWPDDIRTEREEDGRPVLTINRGPQFVRQVTGDIRRNRIGVRIQPADDVASPETAKVFAGLIRHIEYDSDAQIAYVTAGEGAAQCGIGHFRITTEYVADDSFEQKLAVRRIPNHFAVTWDANAIEPTRYDAMHCFVEQQVDRDAFVARYPKASTEGFDFNNKGEDSTWGWFTRDTVRLAEYWTITLTEKEIALLDDDRVVDITGLDEQDGVLEGEDGEPLPIVNRRKVWARKVEMRIINGAEVLEGPFEWPGKYIPIVPVLGEEIHLKRYTMRYGVIRHSKDSQRMYNFWASARTEKIALEPKAPWLVTPKNINGLEDIWHKANVRNVPYLPWKPDKDNSGVPPQRNPPQMGSSAMMEESLIAAEDMKATTGIYDSGVGARSNETSGRAIRERKEQIGVSTIAYSDNLGRAIRHGGRILIDVIPKIYDRDRTIRVMNEDETTQLVRINEVVRDDNGKERKVRDLSVGTYHVIAATGPSYATKRAEAVDSMLAFVQGAPEIAKLILDIVARYSDWPGAQEIEERLRRALPAGLADPKPGEKPRPPLPPSPEQQVKMAETQLKGRDADRKDAETAAKIEKMQAEAQGERVQAAKDALELAIANGALEKLIAQHVEMALAQMFQPGPGNGNGA